MEAVSAFEKRVEHSRPVEQLESRGLDAGGASLPVSHEVLFDDVRPQAMARELARGEETRRPRANDQHFFCRLAGRTRPHDLRPAPDVPGIHPRPTAVDRPDLVRGWEATCIDMRFLE
jgi:hypothetical protein